MSEVSFLRKKFQNRLKELEDKERFLLQEWIETQKIVPFIPCEEDTTKNILYNVNLQPREFFLELGCGDGRNLKLAATEFDAKAVGYEIDQKLIEEGNKVSKSGDIIIHQDTFFNATPDIRKADVIFLYLSSDANEQLRPILEKSIEGNTCVVSKAFSMDGWKPTAVADRIYYYVFGNRKIGVPIFGSNRRGFITDDRSLNKIKIEWGDGTWSWIEEEKVITK